MDRNQQVLGKAFRKVKGKRGAIIRLVKLADVKTLHELWKRDSKDVVIMPKELNDLGEELVITMSKAKSLKDGGDYSDYLDGQQWYLEDLIDFSALTVSEQMDYQYDTEFPSVASEDEMLAALAAVA